MEDPHESFNELMDTPLDFSAFVMNRLKVDTLTPELLAGLTFELIKGSCKCLVELQYFFEEVYKEICLRCLLQTQNHCCHKASNRDDDKLYKFKEGDYYRLRIQDIEDMMLLLVQGKMTNHTVEECLAFNTIWRQSDKDKAGAMIQAIDKQLKTKRIMQSLEKDVVGDRTRETFGCYKGPYDLSYDVLIITEHPSDTQVFTMKMEILLEPTSNKLMVGQSSRIQRRLKDGGEGYSTNSKAFRVFNSRTRIVEENLHVQFSENTPNIAGSGPNWLFDIDALTKSMNYKPVVAGNQSNGSTGTKACDNAGKARMETIPGKDYILLPLSIQDPPFSSSSKDSPDAGFKPSREEEKKDAEDPGNKSGNPTEGKDSEVPSTEEPRINQEKDDNINSTNNINTASDGNNTNNVNAVSSTVNVAGSEVNVVDPKTSIELPNDPNMPELKDIVYEDEDVGAEADINSLDTHIPFSPIPTTRIHKDHLLETYIQHLKPEG
ncbi:hypothetical protein Tco_0541316 [Tanacetum coccineum]